MILIIFGNGVDAQVSLSANSAVASGGKGVRIFQLNEPITWKN